MGDYPDAITPPNHTAPVPRRVRAMLGGEYVFDTTRAVYVWEWPPYPQYYIPRDDIRPDALKSEGFTQHSPRGTVEVFALTAGGTSRPHSAKVLVDPDLDELRGTVRFEWDALDAWFEEDEQIFVHPRNPYSRVDAVRSTRHLRIELEGVVLADTMSPVMVFETGLPTRYYVNRTDVDFTHLIRTDTVTECPYKGTTSDYWSVKIGDTVQPDLAWAYDFPTRQLLPIAGLIAFYNEKVDISLDGELLERPQTHFHSGD